MALHPLSEFYRIGGYTQLSKINCRILGTDASVLLGYLSGQATRYYDEDKIDEEGFFYKTQTAIEFATGLSENKQRTCYKILKELDLIEVKRKGNPAKNHYKINFESQLNLFKEYNILIKHTINRTLQEYSSLFFTDLVLKNLKILLSKNLRSLIISKNLKVRNKSKENFEKILSDLQQTPSDKKSKKSIPDNLKGIPFLKTLELFPPELSHLKNEPEFLKAWKGWFKYRKTKTPKSCKKPEPLTKDSTIWQLNKFKPFSLEEIIEAIEYAQGNANKAAYPNHNGNGNGGNGKIKPSQVNQPKPLQLTEKILDFLKEDAIGEEQFDIHYLNQQMQTAEQYCKSIWDKWGQKQKQAEAEEDWDEMERIRSIISRCPQEEFILEKYIDSLRSWVDHRNEKLFAWNHKAFVKFRKEIQRRYYGMEWETGYNINS